MVADAIVFEASLSFIGGGLSPQEAASSWGSVIAFGKEMVQIGGWWATFFPGLLILLTVLALNILSEGISDAWAAPAARRALAKAIAAGGHARAGPPRAPARCSPSPGWPRLPGASASGPARCLTGAPVLEVKDLSIGFDGRHDGVDIVDGISFDVRPGEVVGLVGESGSGKSLTSLAIMGLRARRGPARGRDPL